MLFISTQSISEFKASNKIELIEVIQNPHTSKLFFKAGTIIGKVSEHYKEAPVISMCKSEDTDETFYILHKKGSANVVDTL